MNEEMARAAEEAASKTESIQDIEMSEEEDTQRRALAAAARATSPEQRDIEEKRAKSADEASREARKQVFPCPWA